MALLPPNFHTGDEVVRQHRRLNGMNLSRLWKMVEDRAAWRDAVHGVTKSRTQLIDWTAILQWPALCGLNITVHGYNSVMSWFLALYLGVAYMWYVSLVAQSCLTLCDPVDWNLPGSSVHGILQTNTGVGWIPFSRGSCWPRDWTWVSCIADGFFTIWATREVQELP